MNATEFETGLQRDGYENIETKTVRSQVATKNLRRQSRQRP